ncbi:hypothetical protein AX14_011669 [Amanita brunnescens Koide BX004]|nr:hypothetical protein AX14_011669 [Amanita brunnescens Koide BX004]
MLPEEIRQRRIESKLLALRVTLNARPPGSNPDGWKEWHNTARCQVGALVVDLKTTIPPDLAYEYCALTYEDVSDAVAMYIALLPPGGSDSSTPLPSKPTPTVSVSPSPALSHLNIEMGPPALPIVRPSPTSPASASLPPSSHVSSPTSPAGPSRDIEMEEEPTPVVVRRSPRADTRVKRPALSGVVSDTL